MKWKDYSMNDCREDFFVFKSHLTTPPKEKLKIFFLPCLYFYKYREQNHLVSK